jgi:hypothetical protein
MQDDNSKIKKFVDLLFKKIGESNSILDLIEIFNEFPIEEKFKIKSNIYPKIEFKITQEEIQSLEKEGIVDDENNFNQNNIHKVDNSIVKLLYALAWKNGDLIKIKHIIEGIKDVNIDNNKKSNGLIFYQFGKYLTKKEGEPIIDQHVLRAFKVYQSDINKEDEISNAINLTTVGKKEIKLIKDYKDWLLSDNISSDLKKELDYANYIDKILFAVGKKIKSKKKMNKLTAKLITFLKDNSNNGQNTITIPLQKKRKGHDSFIIFPIYKNSKIVAINLERRVMPADTVFPVEIFNLVLNSLSKAEDFTLPNGKAQGNRMGDDGLSSTTIEYIVAKEIYGKDNGDTIDRRISVISNILIAANLCEARPSALKLNIK